ncbi:ABC transporter permease [Campylobacterota bacterium]
MKLFLKKMTYLTFMLFLISLISFGAIHAAPNSFFSAGELNPNMTPEVLEHLKAVYGLDKPLHQQYIDWMVNLVSLDFGVSFVSGQNVIDMVKDRIGITLIMNITSMVFIFMISIYLGIVAAMNTGRFSDVFIRQLSLFSFSMPSFYLALLMILALSVKLEWFPIAGLHSIEPKEGFSYYTDMAWHLFLPIFVMIFVSLGSMIVYVRSLVTEILKSDYYFFAKARGLKDAELLRYYILPNLMPPIITLLGLSLPGLIGGSVILESIFGIEGMGQLFYMSALSRDYPVIMGILMVTAFLTLLGNMFSDLILLKLNPYFKRG